MLLRNSPVRVGQAPENTWVKLAGNDSREMLLGYNGKPLPGTKVEEIAGQYPALKLEGLSARRGTCTTSRCFARLIIDCYKGFFCILGTRKPFK